MIKISIKNKKIIIKGHANYDEYGKDIVCASCSSIVITSINAALRIDSKSLSYEEAKDKLTITILNDNKYVQILIENMLAMLKELALAYKENIKIEEEERP